MKIEITPEAPKPATDRRAYLLASALRALHCAVSGRDVLKATADGVFLLGEAMQQVHEPPLDAEVVQEVGRALRDAIFPVTEVVGSDLSHPRIAVSLWATFEAFQALCGEPAARQGITLEHAAELGDSMRWLQAALQELHHRRLLQSRGDTLFRHAVGKLEFDHASLDGKPH